MIKNIIFWIIGLNITPILAGGISLSSQNEFFQGYIIGWLINVLGFLTGLLIILAVLCFRDDYIPQEDI